MENKETLEEAVRQYSNNPNNWNGTSRVDCCESFIAGVKWQQQRMYNEEEAIQKIIDYVAFQFNIHGELDSEIKKWFEQFKKK